MVRLMIAGKEDHGSKLAELSGQKPKTVDFVCCDVANITQKSQLRRFGLNLEHIVCFGSLQMQVRENLNRHDD
jgi:hypothetical protein